MRLARHDPSRRFVLSSGPSDEAAAGAIRDGARRQLGGHADVFPELGNLDLPQLRADRRGCGVCRGRYGPHARRVHDGHSHRRLLGPTLAERSRPWRDPHRFSETVDVGVLPCRPCHQRTVSLAISGASGHQRGPRGGRHGARARGGRPDVETNRPRAGTGESDMSTMTATVSDARTTPSSTGWRTGSCSPSSRPCRCRRDRQHPADADHRGLDRVDGARPPASHVAAVLPHAGRLSGITLVASAFSMDPLDSFVDSKQLVLFLIVPVVYDWRAGSTRGRSATANHLDRRRQRGVRHRPVLLFNYDDLGQLPAGHAHALRRLLGRADAGALLASVCIVFTTRDRTWPILIVPAPIISGFLSVGVHAQCVGGRLPAWPSGPAARAARLPPHGAAAPWRSRCVFAFAPDLASLTAPMWSSTCRTRTNRDWLAMVSIGTAMIEQHPLTGVGPSTGVPRLCAARFRGATRSRPSIRTCTARASADRGPSVVCRRWRSGLGFVVVLVAPSVAHIPQRRATGPLGRRSSAAVAAMLTAGLFEYNFGDSEFLMLFLVVVTLPFAAMRADAAAAAHR